MTRFRKGQRVTFIDDGARAIIVWLGREKGMPVALVRQDGVLTLYSQNVFERPKR
jgi:hypothetical protein